MEERMKDIQSYVENLKIKKALVGGFDEEAVYTSMKELASIYQDEIIKLKKEKELIEKDFKTTDDELSQAKKEIQLLKLQLAEVQTNQNVYDSRCSTLTRAIDAVNESKDKIIQEAKKTADEIIGEAYVKVDRINKECNMQKQQKDLLLSKMSYVKQRFGISMDNLHIILTKLLMEVDELQKDGFDRAFSGKDINENCENEENSIPLINQTNHFTNIMAGSVNEHDS